MVDADLDAVRTVWGGEPVAGERDESNHDGAATTVVGRGLKQGAAGSNVRL